jgi:predicted AlkP superfamily pyrophosphatase or phosphodiesterase
MVQRIVILMLASVLTSMTVDLQAFADQPRLVLFITVDQLRGDYPWRYQNRFGPGGFRYLMERGVVYSQAYYRHSTTFTGTGHATLVTGGHAAQHGIVANDWFDSHTGRDVYCVEDDRHTLIGMPPKPHQGTSPRNLTCSTFADELVLATGGRARVFSVSIKDRGAILPGGFLGKSFWYSSSTGEFVTSTFYYDEYPKWVSEWNAKKHADRYQGESWTLLRDRAEYIYGERDDRPVERSYKQLGRVFPHPLSNEVPRDFYSTLRFTPMGDVLTLDFAKELVDREALGQGDAVDVLAVSLSATDYLGHAFGPNSLEMEDNILRLDRSLADFLDFLQKRIGLDEVLIVLSSDHGVSPIPEHLMGLGMAAGRHRPDQFLATVRQALQQRFQTEKNLVGKFWNPSVYLEMDVLEELKLDVPAVERALADELLKVPGFSLAITRSDLLAGNVPSDPILAKVQRAFHPQRSGHVLVVQNVSWFLYPDPDAFSAMHGSPYPYDTYVPIMFAGPRIEPQLVERVVGPDDIAPTIASYLRISAPSGSTGTPLVEVLQAD